MFPRNRRTLLRAAAYNAGHQPELGRTDWGPGALPCRANNASAHAHHTSCLACRAASLAAHLDVLDTLLFCSSFTLAPGRVLVSRGTQDLGCRVHSSRAPRCTG